MCPIGIDRRQGVRLGNCSNFGRRSRVDRASIDHHGVMEAFDVGNSIGDAIYTAASSTMLNANMLMAGDHLGEENNPNLRATECWYWIRKLQARFLAGDVGGSLTISLRARQPAPRREI